MLKNEVSINPELQEGKDFTYTYLDPNQIQNLENLTTLIQGEVNASDNFGNSTKPFQKNWNSESRIRGALRTEKDILKFTVEDIYPLMDETHKHITKYEVLDRLFEKTDTSMEKSMAVKNLLDQITDFYEKVVKRKTQFPDIDLYELLHWSNLKEVVSKNITLMTEHNQDDKYDFEIQRWSKILTDINKALSSSG